MEKETVSDKELFYQSAVKGAGVNLFLVITNIVMFAICLLFGEQILEWGELDTARIVGLGEYYRLISSAFLHANLIHLGSNMLILLYVGAIVERSIGHIRYLVLYMLCALGGSLLSVYYDICAGTVRYSVGASGAVFGIMGCLLAITLVNRKRLRKGSTFLRRLGFITIYSLFMGFSDSGTNNVAHIGGFITGIIIAAIYSIAFGSKIKINELN